MKYNKKNELIESTIINDNKREIKRIVIEKYNVNKKPILTAIYNNKNELKGKESFEYAENGIVTGLKIYNKDGILTLSEKSDAYGRLIERDYVSNGKKVWDSQLSYDKQGFLGKYTNKLNDKQYTYKYTNIDDNGNWLTSVVYNNNTPKFIIERSISYY